MRRQVLVLSASVLVSIAGVGCAFKGGAFKGGPSEKEALDGVLAAWAKGFNSHDAKALSKLYSEDADGRYGREDIVEGRDAIEKKWAEYFVKNPQVETKLKVVRRRSLASGIVLEDGVWEEWGHTEKNAQKSGVWSSILVKEDGKWLLACDRGSAPVPEPKEASLEKAALDGVLEAWESSFNNHDAKALSQLYAEDADGVFGYEDILRGREAIEKHWADYFAKNPKVKSKQVAIRRRAVTPTVVVEDGQWEESDRTDKEALAQPSKGRWVAILVKQGGKWLVTCDRGFSPIPKATE